ncbi:MAG: exosortase/archaeosortase family protein [Sedimentisphaeraceae bacterium JB056]
MHNDTGIKTIPPKRWSDLDTSSWIKIATITVLFCALFWNNIVDTVGTWAHDDSWSHGFLIPVFSLYLIYRRKDNILSIETRPSVIGLMAMIFLVIFYIFNIVQLRYAYGEPLLMIATLGSVILFMCGWRLIIHLWLPVAYLFFAIPVPTRLYRELTIPLRHIASQFATAFLNLVPDLQATARGVIIDVIYKGEALDSALDVAEACSGMRLLMAFLALGVAMAYLHERPFWQKIILVLSTVPIAVICNIVRVTITAFIHIFIGAEYAKGIYHDTLGLLMLPLAFALYWGLAWFMEQLFVSPANEKEEEPKPEKKVVKRRRTTSE